MKKKFPRSLTVSLCVVFSLFLFLFGARLFFPISGVTALLPDVPFYATAANAATAFFDSKSEGDGFDSPEDAVKAYLEGLRDGDLRRMISAFAIESYAENFNLEAFLKRYTYIPGMEIEPGANEFVASLNVLNRRRNVTEMIMNQYLYLCGLGSDSSTNRMGINRVRGRSMKDEADVSEFVGQFNKYLNEPEFNAIKITGFSTANNEGLPGYILEDLQSGIEFAAEFMGANRIVSGAVAFSLDEKEFLMYCDAVEYGGKWYLARLGGVRGILLVNSRIYEDGGTVSLTQEKGGSESDSTASPAKTSVSGIDFSRKLEGDGFEFPEDALKAYIEGLRDGDFNRVISAFAIESYVENFNFEAYLNMGFYSHSLASPPKANEFVASLNVETRRGEVAKEILLIYFLLCDPGFDHNRFPATRDEVQASEFVNQLNKSLNKSFQTIKFIEFAHPTEANPRMLEPLTKARGAEQLIDRATAVINLGENEFILDCGVVKYGGKWFLDYVREKR